ncbi:MAG: hypothetical protein HPY50_08995 [Firmicutes bacterium]|nr:hypothetical protein [Bacillota bacterium]
MWRLEWKETSGERRTCVIEEAYVRDTLIHICIGGVRLDEIEVLSPHGPVKAWTMIKEA